MSLEEHYSARMFAGSPERTLCDWHNRSRKKLPNRVRSRHYGRIRAPASLRVTVT